jgi:hypothetical protein
MSDTPAAPPQAAADPLDSLIAAAETTATQAKGLALETEIRTAADRSWIAKLIIIVFVGALLVILVLFVIEGYATSNWSIAAAQAADLLKTTLVPIVTLVLGYYFGQTGKG